MTTQYHFEELAYMYANELATTNKYLYTFLRELPEDKQQELIDAYEASLSPTQFNHVVNCAQMYLKENYEGHDLGSLVIKSSLKAEYIIKLREEFQKELRYRVDSILRGYYKQAILEAA